MSKLAQLASTTVVLSRQQQPRASTKLASPTHASEQADSFNSRKRANKKEASERASHRAVKPSRTSRKSPALLYFARAYVCKLATYRKSATNLGQLGEFAEVPEDGDNQLRKRRRIPVQVHLLCVGGRASSARQVLHVSLAQGKARQRQARQGKARQGYTKEGTCRIGEHREKK